MTALQEFIEIIKDKRKEIDISNTLLRFCQVEAEKLLEKEKQQIIDFSLKVKNESGPEAYIEINNLYNETFS